MSAGLAAAIEKRHAGGPLVRATMHLPAGGPAVTVLFGPSGAGKTTVLRCLAGLERPEAGHIRFGGEIWFDAALGVCLPPQRRGVGYLFQEYALFPHLRVARNVGYGVAADERDGRVQELLELVGLSGLADRYPRQLSGGEQQRVALARVLAPRPRLLLLDEPLAALDAPTRSQLRGELRRWLAEAQVPALLVTHDRTEAIALGDTVAVMDQGQIRQTGLVAEVFSRPADAAVARIVGVETVVPGQVLSLTDGLAAVTVGAVSLVALAQDAGPGACYVCIRAEDVIVEKGDVASSARNRLACRVRGVVPEGPLVRLQLDCGFALTALVTRQACRELEIREGDRVVAVLKAPAVHLVARAAGG